MWACAQIPSHPSNSVSNSQTHVWPLTSNFRLPRHGKEPNDLGMPRGCWCFYLKGFVYKKGVHQILADFHFLQDRANFWQTELFWHEKPRSVTSLQFVDTMSKVNVSGSSTWLPICIAKTVMQQTLRWLNGLARMAFISSSVINLVYSYKANQTRFEYSLLF